MKVVILAGGFGTRITDEYSVLPKPMIEIGGKPIIWHIMKIYSSQGFNEFVICLGYKGFVIKEYFINYLMRTSDITLDFTQPTINYSPSIQVHSSTTESWKITLAETGLHSMTGSRIKKIQPLVGDNRFMLTYGDGVSNIDLKSLIAFHVSQNRIATVTAIQPSGRFGALNIKTNNIVSSFLEKPPGDGGWINAGFFVFEPKVFSYLDPKTDSQVFEEEPLTKLASDGELAAYKHSGFWLPMDTPRDKLKLDNMWKNSQAPWKIW
jgi:glucose-1-phosphate cytidylyltransferase